MNKKIILGIMFMFLIISSVNVLGALTDGLKSYYTFDETSGNAIDNVSNNILSQNGTIGSSAGFLNGARGIFSDTNYFSNTNNYSISFNNSFSISIWIKVNQFNVYNTPYQFTRASGALSSGDDAGMLYFDSTNKKPVIRIYRSDGTDLPVTATSALDTGNWHHIVITFNTTTLKIYYDGTLENSSEWTGGNGPDANQLFIGTWKGITGRAFNGTIDETGIYNRTLSQTEVTQLYYGIPYPFNTTMAFVSPTPIDNYTNVNASSYNITFAVALNDINTSVDGGLSGQLFKDGSRIYTLYRQGEICLGNCIPFTPSDASLSVPVTDLTEGTYTVWFNGTSSTNSSVKVSTGVRTFYLNKGLLNVTVFRLYTNSSITNFTVNYTNINTGSTNTTTTTTGSTILLLSYLNNYSININNAGFYTYTQNKTITQTSDTLTFYDFGISQCNTNFTTTTLILKYYQENNPTTANNASTELTFNSWVDNSAQYQNYSVTLGSALNHTLCLINNATSLYADVYIKYTFAGGFTHRYYYYAQPFSTTPTTLNLYNWNTTTLTSTLVMTIKDTATFNNLENIIIKLQRYYAGEDVYRTVQMDRTSLFGTSYFNIQEQDTDYKILFYNTANTLLKESGNTRFSCTAGVCTVEVLVDLTSLPSREILETGTTTYTNTTNTLTTTITDTSGDNKDYQYYVIKTLHNQSIQICNTNTTSSGTATFTCNTTGYNGAVYTYIIVDNLIVYGQWTELGSTTIRTLIGGEESNYLTFGILATLVMVSVFNPIAALVMMIAGIILTSYLGLLSLIQSGVIIIVTLIIIVLMSEKK